MKYEKKLNLVGMILGIVMIIAGVCVMATPARSFSASTPGSYSFGADYYTEQYTATRIAAGNAAVTANNIRELGHKIAQYAGLGFIFAGALICLDYIKKYVCCIADSAESENSPESPVDSEIETEVELDNDYGD